MKTDLPNATALEGLRILLVEDMLLVAMEVESMLKRLKCEVLGPTGRLEDALNLAKAEAFDGALLDVNLDGVEAFPIAEVLVKRGIPLIFVTGYGSASLLEEFRSFPKLEKPFSLPQLERIMVSTFVTAGRGT